MYCCWEWHITGSKRSLGWKEINIVRTDLKGSDITAFGIADNRTSELAEWDDDVLKELLEGLKAEDFDLSAIGFDDDEFAEMMGGKGNEGLTDADDVPTVAEGAEPGAGLGDIYGNLAIHRLMCGDFYRVIGCLLKTDGWRGPKKSSVFCFTSPAIQCVSRKRSHRRPWWERFLWRTEYLKAKRYCLKKRMRYIQSPKTIIRQTMSRFADDDSPAAITIFSTFFYNKDQASRGISRKHSSGKPCSGFIAGRDDGVEKEACNPSAGGTSDGDLPSQSCAPCRAVQDSTDRTRSATQPLGDSAHRARPREPIRRAPIASGRGSPSLRHCAVISLGGHLAVLAQQHRKRKKRAGLQVTRHGS